jgi:hypothetical protein
MQFLRKYSEEVLAAGILVMLGGLGFVLWARDDMDSWPNYLRLASLIPLSTGGLLISLNGMANWDSSSTQAKGKTVGLAVAFAIVLAGTVAWWLGDPGARA